MYITEDDNGNRQPVSEIRKRFENNSARTNSWKENKNTTKKDENDVSRRPVKLSKLETEEKPDNIKNDSVNVIDTSTKQKDDTDADKFDSCNVTNNGDISNGFDAPSNSSKSTVSERKDKLNNGIKVGGPCPNEVTSVESETESAESDGEKRGGTNRVNNFSSYIPVKDYDKGDIVNGVDKTDNAADLLNGDKRNEMNNLNKSRLYQDSKASTPFLFFFSVFSFCPLF